ncbi:MAG: hypothetical protein ACKVP7_06935 [Hyphomicrobiaceae bacterium]
MSSRIEVSGTPEPRVPELPSLGDAARPGPLTEKRSVIVGRQFWLGVVVGGTLASLVGLALVASREMKTASSSVVGACAALDMAAAHGRLDSIGYRRVVRALTGVMNPHVDRFQITYLDMISTCAAMRRDHDGALAKQGPHASARHE